MDNFIDKFAQRKNAQDMIQANAMAEAEEKEKMALRLSEQDEMLQDIRKCSLQNLENAEKVKELLSVSLKKIEETQMQELCDKREDALKKYFDAAEDFNHREAVKVYRNVQAAMEEALQKQSEELKDMVAEAAKHKKISGGLIAVWIITLIAAVSSIGLAAAQLMGIL